MGTRPRLVAEPGPLACRVGSLRCCSGVDVGGTFTDAVALRRRARCTRRRRRPPRTTSRAGCSRRSRRRSSAPAPSPDAVEALRPRDDRRHQRAARGARRAHRAGRHRGLRRPARDRPPGPPRPLPPLRAEAGAAGRRRAAASRPPSGSAPRASSSRSAEDELERLVGAVARARRRVGRDLPALLLPRPRARARDRRAPARRAARRPRLRLARGAAAVPRVRALLDHGDRRLPLAPARPLPRAARRGGRASAGCPSRW